MPVKALVLGFALLVWVNMGVWLRVYDKLNAGDPRVILRDSVRQCFYGAICLVMFEYTLRLDLSRPFLLLFFGLSLAVSVPFPACPRAAWWGSSGASSPRPHYVMVVGTGERAQR